jgi:hypothetical protein
VDGSTTPVNLPQNVAETKSGPAYRRVPEWEMILFLVGSVRRDHDFGRPGAAAGSSARRVGAGSALIEAALTERDPRIVAPDAAAEPASDKQKRRLPKEAAFSLIATRKEELLCPSQAWQRPTLPGLKPLYHWR